jgi:hypothetical protein
MGSRLPPVLTDRPLSAYCVEKVAKQLSWSVSEF